MSSSTITLQPGDQLVVLAAGAPPTIPPPPVEHIVLEDGSWPVQLDTGHMTAIPAVFSISSPAVPTAFGECASNLVVSPAGHGLRVQYPPDLAGGYSPVRFGTPLKVPGTGGYYERRLLGFSPGFVFPANTGIKLGEPRTMQLGPGNGPGENHYVGVWDDNSQVAAGVMVGLQGPNGHFRDIVASVPGGLLTGGGLHTVEWRFDPESGPGSGNGRCRMAVDGVVVSDVGDVLWLAPGNTPGWPYWEIDPTYGGAPVTVHPPALQWWEMDYVVVRTSP